MPESILWGVASEIAIMVFIAIIATPFAAIDAVILNKISKLKYKETEKELKKFKIIQNVVSLSVGAIVGVAGGCIIQFALNIPVLEEDLIFMALFIMVIASYMISRCIFDLFRYKKLKKQQSRESDKTEKTEMY